MAWVGGAQAYNLEVIFFPHECCSRCTATLFFFWAVDTLTLLAFCVTLRALMLYGVTLHAVLACFMRPRSWLRAGAHADDRGHVSDGDGATRRAAAPPAEEAQDRQEAHPLHPGIGRPPVGQQGEIRSSCGILHEVYTRYAAVAAQGQMFVRPVAVADPCSFAGATAQRLCLPHARSLCRTPPGVRGCRVSGGNSTVWSYSGVFRLADFSEFLADECA